MNVLDVFDTYTQAHLYVHIHPPMSLYECHIFFGIFPNKTFLKYMGEGNRSDFQTNHQWPVIIFSIPSYSDFELIKDLNRNLLKCGPHLQ